MVRNAHHGSLRSSAVDLCQDLAGEQFQYDLEIGDGKSKVTHVELSLYVNVIFP
jgi:hypothetical protein